MQMRATRVVSRFTAKAILALMILGVSGVFAMQKPDQNQSSSPGPSADSGADQAAPSADQEPAPKQNQSANLEPKEAEPKWEIAVDNWIKPEHGWLYVLDPRPDGGAAKGRIWLLDPQSGAIKGSIGTGGNADFALLPDGSRLYVASILDGDLSELAVIDTINGTVLQRATVEYREVGDALPAFPTMAVSGDGLALRILIDAPKSEDRDSFLFATIDTRTGMFQRRAVHLGNCGPGRFIYHSTADRFDVLCPRTNRVRLIRVDADSRELQNVDVVMPWERRVGIAEAIEVPGIDAISIVRGDGAVVEMNIPTHQFAETAAHPSLPNRVPPAAWPTSPDGTRVYLGYNNEYDRTYDKRFYLDYGRPPNLRPDDATAAEFHVFDTQSWKKIGTIKTKMHFWSAVLGIDGRTLYAMAPEKHSILVIDTVKMRETATFKVGGAPTLALVAP
jgi:hypothetical protein